MSGMSGKSEETGGFPSRAVKKVRQREEDPPDDGGGNEQTEPLGSKPFSFKDAVMNTKPLNKSLENKWEEDDIDLLDGDIHNEVMDGDPSIDFSNRVYSIIEESMSKLVFIKLLGRKIGYNASWNKVCLLWKPSMHFQLMDIDNDYFLAMFESYLDYSNVLSNGPWVIYWKYMMVQPWMN
ncbi:hypothetical protein PVK06_012481 [Gossypium arboreum]|uniref:DUF4283 domain-containing protein n=1 Tax=Gossypium arboreum TaxID=29729 RepID=A0ABR0QBP4_GOSAR|nr:hypothetical protein PVK06_012481 [Gossypium arboreum]